MTTKKTLNELFDSQVTTSSSSSSRLPPGAMPYCDELEEAFDAILSDLEPDSSIYDTMCSIHEYGLENGFITSGQWRAVRKMLEFREMWTWIEMLEQKLEE